MLNKHFITNNSLSRITRVCLYKHKVTAVTFISWSEEKGTDVITVPLHSRPDFCTSFTVKDIRIFAPKMRGLRNWVLVACLMLVMVTEGRRKLKRHDMEEMNSRDVELGEEYDELEPCQCGVFMSQQVGIREGRRSRPRGPPEGEPVVTYDTDSPSLPCGGGGSKNCISKCLDVILKYLPKAGPVICGAVERDVQREKAFLFIKNCGGDWMATSFSAGKEFCCTDGQHHKC